MTWTRIDDGFPFNKKVVAAGNAAVGVYVRALAWSNAELTDGFVPRAIAEVLAGRDGPKVIARLVGSTLWVEVDGGYHAPDFLDFNPSAESVRARRAEAAERMSNVRARRANTGARSQHVRANATRTVADDASSTQQDGSSRHDPSTSSVNAENVGQSRNVRANTPRSSPYPGPGPGPGPDPVPVSVPNGTATPEDAPRQRDLPVASCSTVERPNATNGLDACVQLRALSGGVLRTGATPAQAIAFGAAIDALSAQHARRDLIDLLGAFAQAGGFAWMTQRKPTTAWLLDEGGKNLTDAIEQAVAWDAAGRGAITPRAPALPQLRTDPRRGILPAASAEDFARARGGAPVDPTKPIHHTWPGAGKTKAAS